MTRARVRAKITLNMGANIYAQLVAVAIQLAFVPIFLVSWGLEVYGVWVIILSIPALFGVFNASAGVVLANEMAQLVGRDDHNGARALFKGSWIAATTLSGAAAILIASTLLLVGSLSIFSSVPKDVIEFCLGAALIVGFMQLQTEFVHASLRSVGLYSLGLTIVTTFTLLEGGAVAATAALGGSLKDAAAALVLVSALGVATMIGMHLRYGLDMRLISGCSDWSATRRLSLLCGSYLGLPGSQLVLNQGVVLALGNLLGPAAAAIFSTHRTLSRTAALAVRSVGNAFWPEISLAIGRSDLALCRRLHTRLVQITLVLSFAAAMALVFAGEWIYLTWTRGLAPFNAGLFLVLVFILLLQSLWVGSSVILKAANRHGGVATASLLTSVIIVILAALIAASLGLWPAALSLALFDVAMVCYVAPRAAHLLGSDVPTFLTDLGTIQFPKCLRAYLRNGR